MCIDDTGLKAGITGTDPSGPPDCGVPAAITDPGGRGVATGYDRAATCEDLEIFPKPVFPKVILFLQLLDLFHFKSRGTFLLLV